MATTNITPTVKLTKAQRQAVLDRAMERGPLRPIQHQEGPQSPSAGPQLIGNIPQAPEPQVVSGDQTVDLSKAQQISEAHLSVPPASELAAYAMLADQLWKDMGGTKSMGGKLWDMYAEDAGYSGTAKDYFVSSFLKWKRDPQGFSKKSPREANLWQALSAELDTNRPVNPLDKLPPRPTTVDPAALAQASAAPTPGAAPQESTPAPLGQEVTNVS